MIEFQAFPSIESFYNVVKYHTFKPEDFPEDGRIFYRGKIKLHGTNAAVRIVNGEIVAQSRTAIITPKADNMGFAKWVESVADFWKQVPRPNCYGVVHNDITVFGEWCGHGIMKGTAISGIGKKVFAIFAVVCNESENGEPKSVLISEPKHIVDIIGETPDSVHILPWQGEGFSVVYKDRNQLEATAAFLNKSIAEIEPCDPWVKSVFGLEGTAEGMVYYPGGGVARNLKEFENFSFKAKGEEHKHVKTKEAVQVDPEVASSIDAFAEMFVTNVRCEQGVQAIGGSTEMKNIGQFLKWMGADILKESVDELAASNLTWDQVQKALQQKAKTWFVAKNKTV